MENLENKLKEKGMSIEEFEELVKEYNKSSEGLPPSATGHDDMDDYNCPSCHRYLTSVDDWISERDPFCPHCGQKINWGKTEESPVEKFLNVKDAWDQGTVSDWFIASVGNEDPVWTEDHIDELLNDFYLFKKESC